VATKKEENSVRGQKDKRRCLRGARRFKCLKKNVAQKQPHLNRRRSSAVTSGRKLKSRKSGKDKGVRGGGYTVRSKKRHPVSMAREVGPQYKKKHS